MAPSIWCASRRRQPPSHSGSTGKVGRNRLNRESAMSIIVQPMHRVHEREGVFEEVSP